MIALLKRQRLLKTCSRLERFTVCSPKLAYKHTIPDGQLLEYDSTQLHYMKEPCLLVNEKDEVVGMTSKKNCHLLENINSGMLHRAFSVFLFNLEGKLLLQQRSEAKITFPGLYTNSCCSHPLMKYPLETEEKNFMGVKRAAQRKLRHELGIPPDHIPLDAFKFITKVQYQAENIPYDGLFGENEIDHILFIKAAVSVSPNRNEVKSYTYIDKEELKKLLEKDQEMCLLTPWFRMISETFLLTWWDKMVKGDIKAIQDLKTIHKLN